MARADGVLRQDQRAATRVPDGERPVSDELRKALDAPSFVSRSDHSNVGGIKGQNSSQLTDEFGTIIQTAVPSDHGSGRRNMWLRFAMRFVRGMEGAIEDPYAVLGIGFIAIGSVRRESRTDSLDVAHGGRLAFEIPYSKLDTHVRVP